MGTPEIAMTFSFIRRILFPIKAQNESFPMTPLPRALLVPLIAAIFTAAGAMQARAQTGAVPNIYVDAYKGEQEPHAPTGSDFLHFFTPEVGPFMAVVSPPIPITSATEVLDVSGLYEYFSAAVRIASMTQPTGYATIITFVPGLGGITSADNKLMIGGDLDYPDEEVSLFTETGIEQDGLPEGTTFKSFLNMDGNDIPFFFADLKGSGVTSANELGLFTFDYYYDDEGIAHKENDNVLHKATADFNFTVDPLVRVGDTVLTSGDNTKVVKTITTLTGSKGTLADGRWRAFDNDSDADEILVLLTFTDGSQAIDVIPADLDYYETDDDSGDWTFLQQTGFVDGTITGLNGYTITSFGLPSLDEDSFAVLAYLKPGTVVTGSGAPAFASKAIATPAINPVVTSSNDIALVVGDSYDSAGDYVLARLGDSVPQDANGNDWSGVTISSFSDPVVGQYGNIACLVTLDGTFPKPIPGIEYTGTAGELRLLANVGAVAPDVTGTGTVGHWASLTSLVLPAIEYYDYYEDYEEALILHKAATPVPTPAPTQVGPIDTCGPIFVGTLAINATDGVNASNNLCIWAVNGYGYLQLIFRTGQTVQVNSQTKTVRTFTALVPAPGSLGAAMGYNEDGIVAVLATFTDGTTALLWVNVPGVDLNT
jgi:hypothetical protein